MARDKKRVQKKRYFRRKKVCYFCMNNMDYIDYKNSDMLLRFIRDKNAKIKSRRETGVCAKHQRSLAVAIKRARHMALLPFIKR